MKKYLVIDEPKPGRTGDSWTDVYSTAEEANEAAARVWDHLTEGEQSGRHVFAAVVDETMLAPEATEGGAVDWSMWANCDGFPGAFDSEVR